MRSINLASPNFLEKHDCSFKPLHSSLDNLFHKLRTINFGADVKHAKIFTKGEEQQLWESNTLGLHSPHTLLNAVLHLNGKNFCLRTGEEHRALKISQEECCNDPHSYKYVENGSKNHNGISPRDM